MENEISFSKVSFTSLKEISFASLKDMENEISFNDISFSEDEKISFCEKERRSAGLRAMLRRRTARGCGLCC